MTETRGKMKMGRPKKNLPASGSDGGGERCLTCVRPRLGSSKLCEWCLTRTDITRLLPVRLFLTYCNVCSCYLQPPSIHVRAERNSNKLLNHCIRCIWRPLRRTIRLLKAEFIESSDHSVIKVRLLLRGEISEGAISDRYHLTEFTVRHKVCKFCCESSISDTQRRVTRVELRQYHVHLRNTLSCLEKAMSEHGLTCRALWIEEHARGTDYIFSDRNHALDLVQFIQGVVPVKKQSDDDGVSATFFSLHIIPICRDDLIAGSLVGGGDNLVICTEVAAHGISLMDPFTLRAAFLTAEDYWRTPFRVVFNSKLLVEYLVLDIIPDPTDADDVDPYCLAHAHIVPVSDDHNKLMVRTHLGRLLKPGDYVLGYDVGGSATEVILVKKSCQLENKKSIGEPSSQEPRSVDTVLVGDSKDEYEEFLREFEENTRLGLISEESQMLPTSPDDVPSNPEGKWLGDEAAADNTTVECLPSTQLSSPQQWEMQQRLQGPGSLLQAHNAIEQKPLIQTQRALQEVSSSTSADSTAQTGHAGAVDWQEELYQKLLSLKELYYADLSEFHHKMKMKLQQQEGQVLTWKQSDQFEKLKGYKIMLNRTLQVLQISSKNSVPICLKEIFPMFEKQVVAAVASQRPKKIPPQAQGQQFQQPNVGNAQPVPHQQPSHGSQMQLTDNHANQVQP